MNTASASRPVSRALVVLSGGQDSATCLFWAKKFYDEVSTITFDYKQHHRREINAAYDVAKIAGVVEHSHFLGVGDILASSSPLTNGGAELETYGSYAEMDKIIGNRIEKTFVPMRNAFFLTLAANHAVALGIDTLVTGVCQADNANYPDCRQTFIELQAHTIRAALGVDKFDIKTPLMNFSKAESIRQTVQALHPDAYPALAFTHTAYSGEFPPKTQDHATVLRAQGFLEAGLPDPLIIRAWSEGLCELPSKNGVTAENYKDEIRNASLVRTIRLLQERLA